MSARVVLRCAAAVARRPSLWGAALVQWKRTTPNQWWRRRPFLPVPSRAYVEFRMVTQYGRVDHPVEADDVLNYLSWCRRAQ